VLLKKKKKHSQITNTISLSFLFITQINDKLYLHKTMNRQCFISVIFSLNPINYCLDV